MQYSTKAGGVPVLRIPENDIEVERLADFNGAVHGPEVAGLARRLIREHPHSRREYWPYLALPDNGEIVAALGLIPWVWEVAGLELRSGEMGLVGTRADMRGQGLLRRLNGHFVRLLKDGDFDFSHIQGIPYFYRQFGYEYAIPLEGGLRLELHSIPGGATAALRSATAADIPLLMQLYTAAAQQLPISARRDAAVWRYLLGPAMQTETAADTWLLLDATGQVRGYWRTQHYGFGEGLNVCECSSLDADAALAVLQSCREQASQRQKPFIRLNLPLGSSLARLAGALGAYDLGRYAWQIMLPDPLRLLRKLGPLFEERIAASAFVGLSQTLVINTYRQAYCLSFAAGKLTAVEPGIPAGDVLQLQLPPNLLAPLLLGQRTLAELQQCYPDVLCSGMARYLVEVLMPPVTAFLYNPY